MTRPEDPTPPDPIADTAMFRRFVEEPDAETAASRSRPAWVWPAVIVAVLLVALGLWLILR